MYEEEEDEKEYEEIEENRVFLLPIILCSLILLIFAVMVMFRALRPSELNSFFECFDARLVAQQQWIERNLDKFCDYFGYERIKIPPRRFNHHQQSNGSVVITSDPYWQKANEKLIVDNIALREEIKLKWAELKDLKKYRAAIIKEFKKKNQTLKENITKKTVTFINPYAELDKLVRAIFRKKFDILVCKSVANELRGKIEKLETLKDYSKSKNFAVQQLPNEVFKILSVGQRASQAKRLITVNGFTGMFENTTAMLQSWLETQSTLPWPSSLKQINADEPQVEVIDDEESLNLKTNLDKLEGELGTVYQDLERELFIVKNRNLDYFEIIQEVDDQIRVYNYFIYDLREDMSQNDGIDAVVTSQTKLKHLNKQSERIRRFKQIFDPEDFQTTLFEAWHRHSLLKSLTNLKLIKYDKLDKWKEEASKEFKEKCELIWKEAVDGEKLYDVLSGLSEKTNFNIDNGLNYYMNLNINDVNSRQMEQFVLKGFKNAKIFPDSMIFSMAALYRILYENSQQSQQELSRIRKDWSAKTKSTYLKHPPSL